MKKVLATFASLMKALLNFSSEADIVKKIPQTPVDNEITENTQDSTVELEIDDEGRMKKKIGLNDAIKLTVTRDVKLDPFPEEKNNDIEKDG